MKLKCPVSIVSVDTGVHTENVSLLHTITSRFAWTKFVKCTPAKRIQLHSFLFPKRRQLAHNNRLFKTNGLRLQRWKETIRFLQGRDVARQCMLLMVIVDKRERSEHLLLIRKARLCCDFLYFSFFFFWPIQPEPGSGNVLSVDSLWQCKLPQRITSLAAVGSIYLLDQLLPVSCCLTNL